MPYTKIVKTGDILEIYEYERDLPERRHSARKQKPRISKAYKYISRRRPDNVRRLSKSFRGLVSANLTGTEKPLFVTLTMAQVVPIKVAYKQYTAFCSRLRRYAGPQFKAITVPEFQKRGAVHFHMLLWQGSHSLDLENERNTRFIQRLWQFGYVDCIQTDGNLKIAGYLAKYMSKALQDYRLSGEKAYSATRNVMRPLHIPYASAVNFSKELFGLDLLTDSPLHEKVFDTYWLGKGRYRKYNI